MEVDANLPAELGRVDRLTEDLNILALRTKDLDTATTYASTLTTPESLDGAAYVLTGAHLMGGEIMRRRLDGYPTKHLEWEDRKVGLAWLKLIREREELSQAARDCFSALLAIMDEIVLKYPQPEVVA
jgi:heme oxygenase